jgi:hypothetical protein
MAIFGKFDSCWMSWCRVTGLLSPSVWPCSIVCTNNHFLIRGVLLNSQPKLLATGLDGRLEDIDLRVLFERLNETVVLHVLGTVLLERKLIFVSQNLR